MTSKPEHEVDQRLHDARDIALAALREITPDATIGPAADDVVEGENVLSLRFHTRLRGYPGWYWTVTVAVVEDSEPTVLEVELLPGDGALLAPDWVPWATRLADYQAAQAVAEDDQVENAEDEDLDDDDDDEEDGDDLDDEADDSDEDDEPRARLHAGDLDGVDIDEFDEDDADEDDDPDDDDGESDEDDDLDGDDADPDDDDGESDEDDDLDGDDADPDDDDERERSY